MRRGHGNVNRPMVTDKGEQKEVIKRIWSYMSRYPLALAVVFFAVILTTAFNLSLPLVLKHVIDNYIGIETVNFDAVLIFFIALAIASLVMGISQWLLQFLMQTVASRVSRDIREDAYNKLQELPISYYDENAHGEIMSVISNDVDTINNALTQGVPNLISSLLSLVGSLVLMFITSWHLTLVNLAVVPIVMYLMYFITSRSFKYFRDFQVKLGQLNGIVKEDITGLMAVQLYNQEEDMIAKFKEANAELREVGFKSQVYSGFTYPLVGFANNLLFGMMVFLGALLHIKWELVTVGDIQSMILFSQMFTRPVSNLAQIFNILQAAIAGGYRVFTLIDQESEYHNDAQDDLTEVIGEVEFKNVNFSYIDGTPVLKNVSFKADPGQVIAIVGPTGSGKTTIINLLNRFYEIDSGDILIDGRSVYEYNKDSLRSQVGLVLQTTYLFKGTVKENIKYGNKDATDEQVIRAAKLAQVHDIIERLPKKYDTEVKEGGMNFSHGERQLISIARTILSDRNILVLDEATSSVDTRTEFNIQKSISEAIKGRTSFIIAHRLQTIRRADIILVISEGEIVERGSHHELLRKGGLYYEMYTTQFKGS